MAQDITALKKSFEEEYKAFLETAKRGSREIRQGELFHRYKQLGLSANDMAKIIQVVDSEVKGNPSKLKSYVRRIDNCIKEFEKRSGENLDQENNNESIAETVETVATEQSEENSAAESNESEIKIRLENLRDEINKYDQNIADNVIAIGEMLIQAKACVKKIKEYKWQDWLSEKIKMPRSTASRYVKCAERFKNVAPAQHLDLSKLTVSKMFELLSVPKDKLEQFLTDVENNKTTIQDMSKNELRDLIKNWKQDNIITDKKPKEKFTVRLNIAESDRIKFLDFLQWVLDRRTLSDETLNSIASAMENIGSADAREVGDTESGVSEG